MNDRIILGIDPGIGRLGYAIVSVQGSALHLLTCDVISTPARHAYPHRLCTVYDQLTAIMMQYRPREAAMESLFFGHNVSTAIPVAQARGVAMLAVVQQGLSLAEYTPSEVKLAVTGYGAAKKAQVGDMVCRLLHLVAVPRPDDAADAAAIAICHAYTFRAPYQPDSNDSGQRMNFR